MKESKREFELFNRLNSMDTTLITEASVSKSMLEAYLEAVLFGEMDDDGEPLDKGYGIRDIEKSSINKAKKDLGKFLSKAQKLLDEEDIDDEQVGHDFYFTRNGHGVGFWDRDLKNGDKLSKIATRMGEIYAYIGDDGKLYID